MSSSLLENGNPRSEKTDIVIWGASGHALVVADIVDNLGVYRIAGFIDNVNPERVGEVFRGSTILGGIEALDVCLNKGLKHLALAFGDCESRLNFGLRSLQMGFVLPPLIHPSAVIAGDVNVGEGTVIAANAVVNPAATIGRFVIVNTSASIDHECWVSDGAHICPGAHLGGRVMVGRATWLGIGAVVRDKAKIGDVSVIGAGSVVVGDIPDNCLAYGVPARVRSDVHPRNYSNRNL